MGKDLLNEFVRAGYLDASVTEGFDPYYEPSWWRGESAYAEDGGWDAFDDICGGCNEQLASWAY